MCRIAHFATGSARQRVDDMSLINLLTDELDEVTPREAGARKRVHFIKERFSQEANTEKPLVGTLSGDFTWWHSHLIVSDPTL